MSNNTKDLTKVSEATRKLVSLEGAARFKLLEDITARFKWDTEVSIVNDLLVGRIGFVLAQTANEGKASKDRATVESFYETAQSIVDKDKDGNLYKTALKWVNRARSDAGYPSTNPKASGNKNRGADRKSDKPVTATTPVVAGPATPTVADPATPTQEQGFSVPKLDIPKPKASTDVGAIIKALASAANKALSESASMLAGEQGTAARDALIAMVAAGRKYEEAVNPLVEKPKPAKGVRLASVIALAEKFNKAPVAELTN